MLPWLLHKFKFKLSELDIWNPSEGLSSGAAKTQREVKSEMDDGQIHTHNETWYIWWMNYLRPVMKQWENRTILLNLIQLMGNL